MVWDDACFPRSIDNRANGNSMTMTSTGSESGTGNESGMGNEPGTGNETGTDVGIGAGPTEPVPHPGLVDGRQSETAVAIQRGTRRLLAALGYATLPELTLANGRRADIVALSKTGEIWIVEIKSSVADFRSDGKWSEYEPYCDRFLFSVAPHFPAEILPENSGLILADAFGAELMRPALETKLSAGRRKAMMLLIARSAALRLHGLADPGFAGGRVEW